MNKIWAFEMNLGVNTGEDQHPLARKAPIQCETHTRYYRTLPTNATVFRRVVDALPSFGVNTVVVNVGEGLLYESHPELASEGAWTRETLVAELAHMRELGLEPIPMLNLSSRHDAWLGDYAYMLSTRKYHEVVGELIDEVAEVFGNPRLFHLGMNDEGSSQLANGIPYLTNGVTRNRNARLLYRDLYTLFDRVEKNGARPWIFGDYYTKSPEEFSKKMPKECLLSPVEFERFLDKFAPPAPLEDPGRRAMVELAELGYDIVPTGSNLIAHESFGQNVWTCLEYGIPDERLLGFMVNPLEIANDLGYYTHLDNAQCLAYAKRMFEDYRAGGRDAVLKKHDRRWEI